MATQERKDQGPEDAKQKVINNEQGLLRKYEEQIRDMAQILEKHLTLQA